MAINDKQRILYHIIPLGEWGTAVSTNLYSPTSIETEGFIHCSTKEQLLFPANGMFKGQTDLILLEIDSEKVTHQIVYEDCYESGIAFPHIYGSLNIDAVTATIPFPPNSDGSFSLPPQLQ